MNNQLVQFSVQNRDVQVKTALSVQLLVIQFTVLIFVSHQNQNVKPYVKNPNVIEDAANLKTVLCQNASYFAKDLNVLLI